MPVNRERKEVMREKTPLYLEDHTLDELIELLKAHRESYGGKACVKKREYDYSDGEYWAIMKREPETDEEMHRRIEQEERWEADRLARELREFERLKKQFGG